MICDILCSTCHYFNACSVYLMLILCKGAVSFLDSEDVCPSSQHATATDASSGEGQLLFLLCFY